MSVVTGKRMSVVTGTLTYGCVFNYCMCNYYYMLTRGKHLHDGITSLRGGGGGGGPIELV